jgi:hypothetical protein
MTSLFQTIPRRCREHILQYLDLKTIACLRQTCKSFNIPELEPSFIRNLPTMPSGRKIPLKYFAMLQDVRTIIMKGIVQKHKEEYQRIVNKAIITVVTDYESATFDDENNYNRMTDFAFEREEYVEILWRYDYGEYENPSFLNRTDPYPSGDLERFMKKRSPS